MQLQMIEKARANRVSALFCLSAKATSASRIAACANVVTVPSERPKPRRKAKNCGVFKSHRAWRKEDGEMKAANLDGYPQQAV